VEGLVKKVDQPIKHVPLWSQVLQALANFGHHPFKHASPDEPYVSVHTAAQK
jgi:hypothetical protein